MRAPRITLPLACLITAMVACSGPPDTSTPSGAGGTGGAGETSTGGAGPGMPNGAGGTDLPLPQSEQFFLDEVYPMLMQACGECHAVGQTKGPAFLSTSAEDTYALIATYNDGALIALRSKNLLLHKGQHEGPAFNSLQRALVIQWLAFSPVDDFSPEPSSTYEALTYFAACMDKAKFTSEVGQVFMTPTDGGCTCATCHAAAEAKGSGGQLVLDADVDTTFTAMQKFPGVMALVQPVVLSTGVFDKLVASHRIAHKGTDPTPQSQGAPSTSCSCQTALGLKVNGVINVKDPTYCHPHYELTQPAEDFLDAFVFDSIGAFEAQTCGPLP